MRGAPAISIKVGRSWLHLFAVAALWILGVAVCLAFFQSQHFEARRMLMTLMSLNVVLLGVIAFLGWWCAPCGLLRWDGKDWHWSGFGHVRVRRLLLTADFQKEMLVRVSAENGAVAWLWLNSRSAKQQWIPLRRAVIDSRAVLPSAESESASPHAAS